ncbi:AraC-type DNA-binding protein [Polaromonas sp. YR568]|uniref:AraC family transcriptional regulator n=1 Tax=Polaromonas sp. YR568 TaxID=1855301 RepID=UPI0008F4199A|nr:AraC family transcriptional regulator [Polaromonas sp. YR568]SFU28269.1 AraC-type DNA-binding protein [Polaromonas sp. YR568]
MQQAQAHTPKDWARFRPGALAGVTQMNAHFTEHSFERHSHETYSIGVTASGVQTFHCGGALHTSLRGDVILLNPDESHDGQRGTQEGFGYSMLYVSQQVVNECRDKEAGLDMAAYFSQPVVRDAAMGQALARAISAAGQAQESLRAEELTRDVLVRLLQRYGERRERHSGGDETRSTGMARMVRIRDYLRSHFDQDITVDTLAREAGLSRVHLTRAFARQFGVPPHIYLNAVRIERAQTGMLAGRGLAEVAAACGFADQSHFSRRFKGSVGLAPGAWLRQMRSNHA